MTTMPELHGNHETSMEEKNWVGRYLETSGMTVYIMYIHAL